MQAFETGAKQTIQPKLVVNQPGDAFEQEADRVADQVMRMPDRELSVGASPAQLSRKCAACEEEDKTRTLQTKPARPDGPAAAEAPAIVHEVLRSPGQPLDAPTRAFFEPRFGHDFGRVRIHTGPQEGRSAKAVNSFGYTVGHNIVFAAERYAPSTYDGARLLAHELTHVMQQQGTDRPALSAEWKIPGVKLQRQDTGPVDAGPSDAGPVDASLPGGVTTPPSAGPDSSGATPSDDAWICGRSLNYPVLNLFFGHSYVKAPPNNYAIVAPLCTPTDGGSDSLVFGGTAARKRDDSCDPGATNPVCLGCMPKQGVTSVKKCLRDAFDSYNSPTMHKAFGPNSNTLAGTMARTCCDRFTNEPPSLFSGIGTFPGWGDPPAPSRPATCPPGPPDCT